MILNDPPRGRPDDSSDRRTLDAIITEYVERLNAGEELSPFEILAAHPDHGPEILKNLDAYASLERDDNEPLGTLGDYTLRRQIGRGGMGVVYEAWQNSVERSVALKVLPAGIAADNKAFMRFMREAKTAAQLSHANVVGVHGMGVEQNTPYYAMEYVEGETLAQILARIKESDDDTKTPFGPKNRQDFFIRLGAAFADVADGLQHAHSKGVVHRDIKPSNLILDFDGRLRILDFGLARLEGQESLTLSGDFVGTPLYMSPEQARRKKISVDHRTDVYSLGATMYEVICGRPPFRGKDHADTLSQIIERDPVESRKVNPRVPKDLETIVLKCLRKDSGDRYGTAEALGQDLRRFVRGGAVEARPLSRLKLWRRRARRHRVPLLIGASFVTVLGVVHGFYLHSRRVELANQELAYPRVVREAAVQIDAGRFLRAGGGVGAIWMSRVTYDSKVNDSLFGSMGTREVRRAVATLEHWSQLLPGRIDAHYHLARGYESLGETDRARDQARQVLEIDPEFEPAYWIGLSMNEQPSESSQLTGWRGDWAAIRRSASEGVIRHCTLLLGRSEEPYIGAWLDAYLHRGAAYARLDRLDRAQEDFVRAAEHAPGSLEPELLLARCYLQSGNELRAREIFDDLLARSPASKLWIIAVHLTLPEPDLAGAIRWAETLAGGALRHRILANLFERRGTWEAAAEAWRRVVQADPDSLGARHQRALALFNSTLNHPSGSFRPVQVLEFAEAAAHLAARTPEDRKLGALLCTSLEKLSQYQPFDEDLYMIDAKRRLRAALAVMTVSLGAGGASVAMAQTDDFEDGDIFDGRPMAWRQGACCNVFPPVVNGTIEFTNMEIGVIAGEHREGAVTFRLRGSFNGTDNVVGPSGYPPALIAHVRGSRNGGAYWGWVHPNGGVHLVKFRNFVEHIHKVGNAGVSFLNAEEVVFEICAKDGRAEARAWLAGEPPPEHPHAQFDDLEYPDGRIGFGAVHSSGNPILVRSITVSRPSSEPSFLRGDCNDDGEVNISDANCALEWLFAGPAMPNCLAALNTNGDAKVDIADPVYLLNFLFAGGDAPVDPFPDCGPGAVPADEELGCANPPSC